MPKIELQEPYKSRWKSGYLVTNKEPRRNVVLYNSPRDRTTVPYARYIFEVSLGYFLPKNLYVDHRNNDTLDDRLENLQLLDNRENSLKSLDQRGRGMRMVEFECGTCYKVFVRPRKNTHLTIKSSKSTYCSRSCAGKRLSPSKILREFTKTGYFFVR